MFTDREYMDIATEYVRDFFDESELYAMAPVIDESATVTQDILVVVKANNWNYSVVLNDQGEVLDCQRNV